MRSAAKELGEMGFGGKHRALVVSALGLLFFVVGSVDANRTTDKRAAVDGVCEFARVRSEIPGDDSIFNMSRARARARVCSKQT